MAARRGHASNVEPRLRLGSGGHAALAVQGVRRAAAGEAGAAERPDGDVSHAIVARVMGGVRRRRSRRASAEQGEVTPLDVAARMLVRTSLTEAALRERLVGKGYQPETAERTVARCRELGYADDERLAFERARTLRARGAGSLKIAADLEARGLPERLVAAAIEASRAGEPEQVWARRALARAGEPRGARAWRLLATRGFPDDVLSDVLGDPD